MHAWARVVSRPEVGLALLDAGKRDVPFDEGLPEPQLVADQLGAPARPLTGAQVTAVNDQHSFLRIDPEGSAFGLKVGQVVRLGLSHPCTALDKWRWIPVIAGDSEADPVVIDLIRTFF
jgi:D-serine deaminase-like pyridoxal phosphate-dependent protein